MVFDEFLRDSKLLDNLLNETPFIAKFGSASAIASNAKAGATPDWRTELENLFNELDSIIIEFERANKYIIEESKFLELINIHDYVVNYRQIISKHFETDIITADTNVNNITNLLNTAKAQINTIVVTLANLGVQPVPTEYKEQLDTVSFEFRYDADVKDLASLSKAANKLNSSLKALSKLDPEYTATEVEIVVMSKASPLLITAWVTEKAAKALDKIIRSMLDYAKKVDDLREMEEKIKGMQLDNDKKKIENDLASARAKLELGVIAKITQEIVEGYPQEGRSGAFNEVEKDVRNAVTYFIEQSSKGLEIKILPRSEDLDDGEFAKKSLEKYHQNVRELRELRHLLPSGSEQKVNKKDVTHSEGHSVDD